MLYQTVVRVKLYSGVALLLPFLMFAFPVQDATHLSHGTVAQRVKPQSIQDLCDIIRRVPRPVAIAGAGYSQGGQAWVNYGTVIDMTLLNSIHDIDITNKTVTVEAGATWRQLQEALSPIGLSPQVMQSYNDFSVGGSLSVNAHGRNTTGSIVKTVDRIKVLLPSGHIVTADRCENTPLFYAAIGGYGACGIIVEATISLVDNVAMQCESHSMNLHEYIPYLRHHIINNPDIILHNANLYPNDFNQLLAVNWIVDTPYRILRSTQLVRPDSRHLIETYAELVTRRLHVGQYLRKKLEKEIVPQTYTTHRNYEISRPVATLGPWTQILSSNILQEYFIPLDHLEEFITKLRDIRKQYNVNIINASLRYVPADTETILSYAPQDCCSVVLYINVIRVPYAFHRAQRWTQELIDAALCCHGTYYLPYHLFASVDQFQKSYPRWQELINIKREYDPDFQLSNSLLDAYIT